MPAILIEPPGDLPFPGGAPSVSITRTKTEHTLYRSKFLSDVRRSDAVLASDVRRMFSISGRVVQPKY